MLCQEEERGLIHHGATDIRDGRLAQPVVGQFFVAKVVVAHGAVEGGVGILVGAFFDSVEPLVADAHGFLELALGTEDIHLQVKPLLAALLGYRQHGVAIQVLEIVIMAAHVFALGVIAHFAADVHPGILIGHKPCGVEDCLVDLAELVDGFGVRIGIGALISQQCMVTPCDIRTLE